MIRIFTINESGEVVEETAVPDECLTLATADRIYLRPDWPPIGSPDFAARLRAWHEKDNHTVCATAQAPNGEH